MAETLTYTYTTQAEMCRLMRTADLTLLADLDADGNADTGVVDDWINEATDWINLYCLQHYNAADMANNLWVRRRATLYACHVASRQKANGAKYQDKVDKIEQELERVKKLEFIIPRLGLKVNLDPSCSNYRVDQRYQTNQVRVTPSNSPGGTYSGQAIDQSDYDFFGF